MRLLRSFQSLLILSLLIAQPTRAATNLLPGVIYFDGGKSLTGKLLFLLSSDVRLDGNSATSASVYEFDLLDKTLRKVADAPQGIFIPSKDGRAFCVIYGQNNGLLNNITKAFVYSESLGSRRIIDLDSEPQLTVLVGDHVFFQLERLDTDKQTSATKLLDYNISRDEMHQVEFRDAAKWQYQHYNRIHLPREQTNVLHFYYKGYGRRLEGNKDVRDGYYRLDVSTGDIRWFAELLDDKDDERYTFRTADGRYVFFEGPDAPVRGFKLLSSPLDFRKSKNQERNIKVLKAFSILSAHGGDPYAISQISPDGRFVLIRLQEPVVPKFEVQPGWMNTYFLVDASDGDTHVLLKEDVEHTTSGSMSAVEWIR